MGLACSAFCSGTWGTAGRVGLLSLSAEEDTPGPAYGGADLKPLTGGVMGAVGSVRCSAGGGEKGQLFWNGCEAETWAPVSTWVLPALRGKEV